LPSRATTRCGLRFVQIIWPSAARAYELLNGVKLGALHAPVLPPHPTDRHKRQAEDAFGPDYSFDRQFGQSVDGVQDVANKLMAHMLGLDIPGVEPSTSFYTGCDWWARPNQEPMSPQNWPQPSVSVSSTLPFPQSVPQSQQQTRGWPDSREALPYNDGGYRFDQFGV
jgi:hypothetical protein